MSRDELALTQPGPLLRPPERVRRDGHATTVEEMSLGAGSVAVPVRRGEEGVAARGIGRALGPPGSLG